MLINMSNQESRQGGRGSTRNWRTGEYMPKGTSVTKTRRGVIQRPSLHSDIRGAISWQHSSIPIQEKQEWIQNGHDVMTADRWRQFNFKPTEVNAWIDAGFISPETARKYANQGYDPISAADQRRSEVQQAS